MLTGDNCKLMYFVVCNNDIGIKWGLTDLFVRNG